MKGQVRPWNVTVPGILKTTRVLLLLSISLIASNSRVPAQNSYDIGTPAASKAGESTASTYNMDKVETVNLANGNLSLNIPLVTIGGRGSANYTLALSYNSKLWSTQHDQDPGYYEPGGSFIPPFEHYRAKFDDAVMRQPNAIALAAGWSILKGPAIKVAQVNISPVNPNGCSAQQISDDACGYKYILTKAWLTLADGSEVELRDAVSSGAPALTPVDAYNYHLPTDRDRGRVWQSTDGSAVTYISDANNGVVSGQLAGWVFLSDGTRLRMEAGPYGIGARCTKVLDRQGNFISIDYNAPAGTTYTDELGRQVVLQSTSSGLNVVVKGYNGISDRVIVINTAMIGALDGSGVPTNLRADFPSLQRPFYSGDYLRTPSGDFPHTDTNPHTDLFPGSENTFKTDTYVTVTSLQLLDGRSFRFRYNQYGELAEIVYPGGGVSQIDFAPGSPGAEAGCSGWPVTFAVNRIVVQRRALTNGVSVDAVWSYSQDTGLVAGVPYPRVTVEVRQGSVTGPLLLSEKHYFLALDADHRACRPTFFGSRIDDTGYEKWENAKEFRVERQTGSGTQIEKRTWQQRATVVWAPDVGFGYNAYAVEFGQQQPANDPRVTIAESIVENGKMKRLTFDYDLFNNVTLQKEYDFGGTNGSLGPLVRQTARTFGANMGSNYGASINGYCYTNLNPSDSTCGNGLASVVSSIIHQRRPLLNETVKDANNNQKAYAEFEYDNYTASANHAALVINAGMIQYDGTQFSSFASSYQPRSNVTKVSRWAGGANYIYLFSQYDIAGNVIWTKDANGNVTTVAFADNFGNGSNPDSGAGGTNGLTYALATLVTNPLNHQAKSQYDYTRGVSTGSKDPNGVIAKTEYDLLGRPTRVTSALGLAVQTIAETTHPSATTQSATTSRQLDATRWLASKIVLDGFDRTITSWQAEDGQHATVASFTIRTDTVYDGRWRFKQVSNPYRPGAGESAVFTTTAYDLAGRVITVTTPDNAVVTTTYSGNTVTVADQINKQRKSETDGLAG